MRRTSSWPRVIHWRKTQALGWKSGAFINGFGALVTGIVLIIVAVTKTLEGAWIGGLQRAVVEALRYAETLSLLIKGALLFRPNIVVTSVPFHLTK
jgi:hypothetical protein